jgi:hypothetical protein
MALTDFWQLKDHQIIGGQNILNVYHAKRILVAANSQVVALGFINSILTANFLALQDNGLTRTVVECENLGDPTDFVAEDSSAFPGTDVGDRPAIFNAATIQFNRTRTDMKNGQKRYLMGNDNDSASGVYDATFISDLDAVAATIIAPWRTAAAPAVDVCSFVILKRFCVVPDQEPCLKYRLPETDVEIDGFHYVPISTTQRNRVRSQVSRKRLV